MRAERILLAAPQGFCAGVEAAVKSLAWMVAVQRAPVFCVHAIVHNEAVVARFERLGVRFVESPADVPAGAPVLLSAHGSAPEVVAGATRRASVVVDAVCPLVTKVHREIRHRAAAGDTILYFGARGHDEALGATAQAPESVVLVGSAVEVRDLPVVPGQRVSVLGQTTLSVDEWDDVLAGATERFGTVWSPARQDICFATSNRQRAVRAVAGRCDTMVVVGSATSSNTASLVRTARAAGCGDVVRVMDPSELGRPNRPIGVVGVTAGASTPKDAVDAVVASLGPAPIETVVAADEREHFPLAPGIRSVVAELVAADLVPAPLRRAFEDDRHVSADDLLSLVEALVPVAAR